MQSIHPTKTYKANQICVPTAIDSYPFVVMKRFEVQKEELGTLLSLQAENKKPESLQNSEHFPLLTRGV